MDEYLSYFFPDSVGHLCGEPSALGSTLCINVMVMKKMHPLLIDVSSPVMVRYLPLTSKTSCIFSNSKGGNSYKHACAIVGMHNSIMGAEEY